MLSLFHFLFKQFCFNLNCVVWQSVSLPLGGSRLLENIIKSCHNNRPAPYAYFYWLCSRFHLQMQTEISVMSFVMVHSNHLCFICFFAMFMSSVYHICSSHRNKCLIAGGHSIHNVTPCFHFVPYIMLISIFCFF